MCYLYSPQSSEYQVVYIKKCVTNFIHFVRAEGYGSVKTLKGVNFFFFIVCICITSLQSHSRNCFLINMNVVEAGG